MPDFEGLMDDLKLHKAKTSEEETYITGYIDGKDFARKQILYISIMLASIILVISIFIEPI